jgi:hypothetical protein
MWAIGYFVEDRVLIWRFQYYAFVYGDLLLAVGYGCALYGARRLPESRGRWWQLKRTHVIVLLVCLSVALWRWGYNDYPGYSVGQSASPDKLYHDSLFVIMGYLFLSTLLSLLGKKVWVYAIPVCIMFVLWGGIGLGFDQHAAWKMSYAHVDYDWFMKDLVGWIDPWLRSLHH